MNNIEKIKHSVKFNGIINGIQQLCRLFIPVITFPYLSQVLGPDSYGKYSFSNSIVNYFLLFGMMGINTYAVREGARIRNKKNEISDFASQVFCINILFISASLIMLCITVFNYEKLFQYKNLILILCWIIPSTCLGREWINTIYEDYLYITLRYIIIQLIGVVAVFAFIHSEQDYIKYTAIYTIISCSGPLINLIYTQKYIPIRITLHVDLKKHLIPLLILFCGQVAVTIYIQSDITMIGLFLNDLEVGIYTVASKIYVVVKSIVNAVTTVTIPRLVYYLGKEDNKQFEKLCKKISGYLIVLVIPMTIGLFFESKNILLIIGGNRYLPGIDSLKILSFALLFAVFSGFYCNAVLIPKRKEKQYMLITIFAAVANIIGNYILIPKIGIGGAAFTTIVSEALVCILCIFSVKSIFIDIGLHDWLSLLIGNFFVIAACIFVSFLKLDYCVEFIMSIVLSMSLYLTVLILFKNSFVMDILVEAKVKRKQYK